MSYSTGGYFKIISDGDKVVFVREVDGKPECIVCEDPILTSFRFNMRLNTIEVSEFGGDSCWIPGHAEHTVDLSLLSGRVEYIERPLVMGVDIFSRYSIIDYLNIINKKISQRDT